MGNKKIERLKLETADVTQNNIEKIGILFPNVITEMPDENGQLKKAINFELLKQELSHDVVDGDECYEFTWVGKKASMVTANTPIRKTLRPVIEESKNWETTENLYIEGDNLEVLKLLQESYLNKVKMIYIDPPYNTGNDLIYKDNFTMDKVEYEEEIGLFDEEENRLFKNTDTNGRFHSDWCSMIYPRLKLARNLLSEDGVIFISIDDNEVDNLRKICDEVFGEGNFVAEICHKSRASVSNDKIISINHNTILFYSKNQELIHENRRFYGLDPKLDGFNESDERGEFRYVPVDGPGGARKGNPHYEFLGITGYWRFSKETMQKKYEEGFVVKRGNSLYQKYYRTVAAQTRRTDTTWWDGAGLVSTATSNLRTLMGGKIFDTPKPVELIIRMLKITTFLNKDSIILDFFAGSSTTAHAVMQLNAEDGGNRKFIMVQLPEETEEISEAYKAGYKNIAEIGKERIRRAGEKTLEDYKDNEDIENLDIGFRVLKMDTTNMKDVYYAANEITQDMLSAMESNIKEDRTDLDLLYGVLLDWALPLSLKHDMEEIDGVTVHTVNEGVLVACFAERVTEDLVREIAKRKPLRVVFRDSSFANSPDKINVTEIFKLMAPDTTVRVI